MSRLTAGVSAFAYSFGAGAGPSGSPRGARNGRRSALFEQARQHINSDIAGAGATLRGRCRFLARENALAQSMKRIWTDYAVGAGWTPSLVHDNPDVVKAFHRAFKVWTDQADFYGLTDFYGIQANVADEEFEAGEQFVRIIDPLGRLRLQTLASEQLPYSNIGEAGYALPAGHEIRLGIEFDAEGQRVAYHFYRNHPGDGTKTNLDGGMLVRIPAEEIIHVYTAKQSGQIRGYSRLTGAIVPLFKLEEYEDALLERAAQSAKYIGTIERPLDDSEDPKNPYDDSGEGARQYTLETGTLYELSAGEKLTMSEPPEPGSGFDEFTRRAIAKACMAVGTPYAETSGDLKSANFSSARIGRQPFRRACERWGYGTLTFQLNRAVWRQFVRWALLTNAVSLPRGASRLVESYLDVNWIPPAWEYVNPVDDAKADQILVDAGFKPRSKVIEASGANAEETDEQIGRDQMRADRLNLRIGPAAKAPAPTGRRPAKPATPATEPKEPA